MTSTPSERERERSREKEREKMHACRSHCIPVVDHTLTFRADLTTSSPSWKTNAEHDFFVTHVAARGLLGVLLRQNDELAASPEFSAVRGSFDGFPNTFISVGSAETLLSDSERVAEKIRAAGGKVTLSVGKHMCHDFPNFRTYT